MAQSQRPAFLRFFGTLYLAHTSRLILKLRGDTSRMSSSPVFPISQPALVNKRTQLALPEGGGGGLLEQSAPQTTE